MARLGDTPDHGETEAAATLLTLHAAADLDRISPSALLAAPGRIAPTDADVDVFRLDVPENTMDVTVRSAGGTDVFARLLDSSLNEIAADTGDGNFRIEARLGKGSTTSRSEGARRGRTGSCLGPPAGSVRLCRGWRLGEIAAAWFRRPRVDNRDFVVTSPRPQRHAIQTCSRGGGRQPGGRVCCLPMLQRHVGRYAAGAGRVPRRLRVARQPRGGEGARRAARGVPGEARHEGRGSRGR